MLHDQILALIDQFARRRGAIDAETAGHADDPWRVDLRFDVAGDSFRLRSLSNGDDVALEAFGSRLGQEAREMFAPYPWDDADACREAFAHAVEQSIRRIDASYLLEVDDQPVGHFFLWKAGGGSISERAGLSIPELGVAIADSHVGRGLGSLAVRFLLAVAQEVGADAVELTTAENNDDGWRAYISAGFSHIGQIRVPLGVDVTAAEAGEVGSLRHRVERQMVAILRPDMHDAVFSFLASKRISSSAI